MFIVEFNGPKGWEVAFEGHDAEIAMATFADYLDDYDCRITIPKAHPLTLNIILGGGE